MIKYLIMDVDGTLTDGKIYMGSSGEMFKAFEIKDGVGIHDIAIPFGIEPVIITGRSSEILKCRCSELGITRYYQGISDKVEYLTKISNDFSEIAYIGDDINDLPSMIRIKEAGGLIGCPADAVKSVKETADYICAAVGGNGAVREFIEWLTENRP